MKKGLLLAMWGISMAAQALPPEASFDGMSPSVNGDITYTFQIAEFGSEPKKVSFVDNDGAGTLIVLNYMLVQQPMLDLWNGKAKWETLKKEKVQGYSAVAKVLQRAVERFINYYDETVVADIDAQVKKLGATPQLIAAGEKAKKKAKDLQELARKLQQEMAKWPADGPTYEQFNEVGAFVTTVAAEHSYPMTINGEVTDAMGLNGELGNQTNPLGSALSGIGYTLPPDFRSRSAAHFDVDLKRLMAVFNATKAADSKKPGATPNKPQTHK